MLVPLGSSSTRMLHRGGIYTVIFIGLAALVTGDAMEECGDGECALSNTISYTIVSIVTDECVDNGTTVTISCNRGFTTLGEKKEFNTTCNGVTGEFKDKESCPFDLTGLLLAIVTMMVILFLFSLLVFLVRRRFTRRKKKAMYDNSQDVSEIIDGHLEEGGVVNIAMTSLPPSPRTLIPIEDYDYENHKDVRTQTKVEVHYANASAALRNEAKMLAMENGSALVDSEDTADGYGTIDESGMVPQDPQAGNSTEKLIDTERDEPDGEDYAGGYASIGEHDRPLNRARRGPSDTSLGGSARVRPVTAPPVFSDKSASVRGLSSADAIPIEAMYAKINKVKRASERWPPGSKDPTRPRGRPADLDDLLKNIDKPSWSAKHEDSPTRPREESKPVEELYAEVPENMVSASAQVDASPPAPKPARNSSETSGRKPIKRYAPPSQSNIVVEGSQDAVMYTEVGKPRPASTPYLTGSNFDPLSPPPPPPPQIPPSNK